MPRSVRMLPYYGPAYLLFTSRSLRARRSPRDSMASAKMARISSSGSCCKLIVANAGLVNVTAVFSFGWDRAYSGREKW